MSQHGDNQAVGTEVEPSIENKPEEAQPPGENAVKPSAPPLEDSAPMSPASDASREEASPQNTPSPATGEATFKSQFRAFSKFGDLKSDGKNMTLSQSDKWMKQAKVIDGKKITTTDTGIYFKKLKSQKLGIEDYQKFLADLAKNKKIDVEEMKKKMASCGAPGLSTSTQSAKAVSTVERLTDTSRYTGSHKQRFDESGKGKGIAGRKDISDSSGYVQGYQNKNTYDKMH